MNDSTTLERLHHHFAHQLGCQPEDLARGNRQVVISETRGDGNAAGPSTPLWAISRNNGWIISVSPEAYSSTNIVLQTLPTNQDPLSEPVCRNLHETVKKVAPISFYYSGLLLYADRDSFRPYSVHPVQRLTLNDLPALKEARHPLAREAERIAAGDVFAVREGDMILSYALIRPISAEVCEIVVETKSPYRRQGYAKSAVSAATQAVLESERIPVYSCDEHNFSSRRVAEVLGYKKYANDFVCLGR